MRITDLIQKKCLDKKTGKLVGRGKVETLARTFVASEKVSHEFWKEKEKEKEPRNQYAHMQWKARRAELQKEKDKKWDELLTEEDNRYGAMHL